MKNCIIPAACLFLSLSSYLTAAPLDIKLSDEIIKYESLTSFNQLIAEQGGMYTIQEDAKKGLPEASFIMGEHYRNGYSFEKDNEKAKHFYFQALKYKYPKAYYGLGKVFLESKKIQDKQKGVQFIIEAANQGITEAQYMAAILLLNGNYVTKDTDAAMFMLSQSADKGFSPAFDIIDKVLSSIPDFNLDFNEIHNKAIHGNANAMAQLANLYYQGWIVSQDKKKAIRLAKLAAGKGNEQAIFYLKKWTY